MLLRGDARHIPLPDGCVQCVVTSPPYWGLRDYKLDGKGIGLEKSPEEYVANIVTVFREVWRVLRDDGTLWLNMGDSYANAQPRGHYGDQGDTDTGAHGEAIPSRNWSCWSLKPKDLVGMPWRVAFALQADGWYLRSDIIWAKPNPMPESVRDRPTKAHEYLFLLAKAQRYYYDAEAIKEPMSDGTYWRLTQPNFDNQPGGPKDPQTGNRSERKTLRNQRERLIRQEKWLDRFQGYEEWKTMNHGRNRRDVWFIPTQPYKGAHFATFPEKLVEPCILAGTSAKGNCPVCGKPWERMTETERKKDPRRHTGRAAVGNFDRMDGDWPRMLVNSVTVGWHPTCDHDAEPMPALVLDPFCGSGTVGAVARRFGRRFVGIDLSAPYLQLAQERIGALPLGMVLAEMADYKM